MTKTVVIILIVVVTILFFVLRNTNSEGNFSGTTRKAPQMVDKKFFIDDEVINLKDVQQIIDPVWLAGNIYGSYQAYEESLSQFTPEQRHICAIMWYSAEVNNGGHYQFYSNSTGIVWKNALVGLRAIGAPEAAKNLEQSFKVFNGEPGFERSKRNEILDNIDLEVFEKIDSKFYKLDSKLYNLMLKYILENKNKFYFNGTVKVPKY